MIRTPMVYPSTVMGGQHEAELATLLVYSGDECRLYG